VHFPIVDYFKLGTSALDDLTASRWKPTWDTRQAHPTREKLDETPNGCCRPMSLWAPQGCQAFPLTGPFLWLHQVWDRCLATFKGVEAVRSSSTHPTPSMQHLTYEACDMVWAERQQHVISLGNVVPPKSPWAYTPNHLPWFYQFFVPYAILLKDELFVQLLLLLFVQFFVVLTFY